VKFSYRHLLILIPVLILAACSGDSLEVEIEPTIEVPVQESSLNAGEIDDNAQWGHYLQYRTDFLQTGRYFRDVDVSQRQIITVKDSEGLPVPDARVQVFNGQDLLVESRTYADGRTLFFPSAWQNGQTGNGYRVAVQKDQTAVDFTLDPQSSEEWFVELDAPSDETTRLDVLFLLDATGSMGDEIAQLQENILAISAQIDDLPGELDVRYGLVTYRDRGDEYVTRTYDFVSDVNDFQNELSQVRAAGGGDNPESLNEALHVAVHDVSWRDDEEAIKLMFLVADAPPHLDYPNDYDYGQGMVAAAWRGIKIHPIASSNTPQNAEYIFRQIASYTMGHFVFLTYENGTSGEAGTQRDDLQAGQDGNYGVAQLDDLVLRLITDEIAALGIPIENRGDIVQAAAAAPEPLQSLPASFALTGDLIRVQSSPVVRLREDENNVNWPGMIFLFAIMGSVIIFFILVFVGAFTMLKGISDLLFGKRKRKNDEAFNDDFFFKSVN
jgi:hypothetical protein